MKRLLILSVLLLASGCTSVGYKMGLASCAPVYGNWCGENYPLAGNNPSPVDGWDRACRAHDRCYEAGKDKLKCDRELVSDLEDLSRTTLAPIRMHNAYNYFRFANKQSPFIGGWVQFTDEMWGMTASCKGGDGRAAQFFCATPFGACPVSQAIGPGHHGTPTCHCSGVRGQVVER